MKKIFETKWATAFVIAFAIFFTVPIHSQAQTPAVLDVGDDPGNFFGGSGGGTTPFDGGATVPFDGGLSLLLFAAGVGYTAKAIRKKEIRLYASGGADAEPSGIVPIGV